MTRFARAAGAVSTLAAGGRPRLVIAKRRKRLMWLTGAALSAGSGLVIIVSVIVHALHAEYAEGLRAVEPTRNLSRSLATASMLLSG